MVDKSLNQVSESLVETLEKSDLASVSVDLAEISLDQLITNDIFREIPILSILVGIGRTVQTVRDQLFLKKIIYFISEVSSVPPLEREKVINEIDKSKKYRLKVGEKLLYIIDKSEDYKAAELVAKLFTAFLKRDIDYSEFLKASMIVNNVYIEDLKQFLNSERDYGFRAEDVSDMLGSGLYEIEIDPIDVTVEDQDDYKASSKYSTRVDGGDLRARISSIGRVIKKVLKDQAD